MHNGDIRKKSDERFLHLFYCSSMSMFSRLLQLFKKSPSEPKIGRIELCSLPDTVFCPVCKSKTAYLDSVDFNKSCEEARGFYLPPSGVKIQYFLCASCWFCFAPEIAAWNVKQFEEHIYDEAYELIDPDYRSIRPLANADMLHKTFGSAKIRHLDYGGGSGLLSGALKARSWDSYSYDPFTNPDLNVVELGKFDLITAFEVFEHVPNVDALFADLQKLVKPDAIILFSTLLSDGEISQEKPLTWWYASPRNGHISLFSQASLKQCLRQQGFNFASFSAGLHVAYRQIPAWSAHLFQSR
ncbi:MAG: class I SAM-dependent methyltransferase [Burkholderiaceae bacterium]|nr:class I SAM-dependent methyltransferase [Burkholderiaceae bacterium]